MIIISLPSSLEACTMGIMHTRNNVFSISITEVLNITLAIEKYRCIYIKAIVISLYLT